MNADARKRNRLQVAEQAAEWLGTLNEGRKSDRVAFVEWVQQSPLHLEQFLLMSAVEREAQLLAVVPGDVDALLARAGTNVVEFPRAVGEFDEPPADPQGALCANRRQWKSGLRIAASLAVIGLLTVAWWLQA